MHHRTVSLRTAIVSAVAIVAIALPLGAVASHQFPDVPDSNAFHADIDALVDSGVTSGCGGGNYCPSGNVTREQMAAFLNRLGALAPGKTPVVNAKTAQEAENAASLGGVPAASYQTDAEAASLPSSHLVAVGQVDKAGGKVTSVVLGDWVAGRSGTGAFEVTLPGWLGAGCVGGPQVVLIPAVFDSTIVGGSAGAISVNGIGSTCPSGDLTFYIETRNAVGDPADRGFVFQVYSE